MLIAAALVGAVLAGCGGSSSSSSSGTHQRRHTGSSGSGGDSQTTAADTSEGEGGPPSGTLGWSTAAPTAWDPVVSAAGNDVSDLSLVYASLTRLSPEGEAEPALAEKWDFSKDGLTFTIYLKKGPEIHRRHAGQRGSGEDQPRTR